MNARIILHKDQVLHGIETLAYKFSEAAGLEPKQKNVVAADHNENLDADILSRMMDLRDARLRKRLRFVLSRTDNNVACDKPNTGSEFVYDMLLEGVDGNDLESAKTLMHEYMVRGSLRDWYLQLGIQTAITTEEVDMMEEEIVSILRGKSFIKAPMQPFGPKKKYY